MQLYNIQENDSTTLCDHIIYSGYNTVDSIFLKGICTCILIIGSIYDRKHNLYECLPCLVHGGRPLPVLER